MAFRLSLLLILVGLVFSCNPLGGQSGTQPETQKVVEAVDSTNIVLPGVQFTRSINGGDSLIKVQGEGALLFTAGVQTDYFNDPGGVSNNSAPMVLAQVDNMRPFTFVAKVKPTFTAKDTYNAGVVYIYVNDSLYQKTCFEQDERGHHRVVTVRTNGTSDDNNHDVITQEFVYMKISSDTKTVATYYSLDNQTWQLVRLYRNNYPSVIWMGISTQSPVGEGTTCYFEDILLTQESVKDFRLGT